MNKNFLQLYKNVYKLIMINAQLPRFDSKDRANDCYDFLLFQAIYQEIPDEQKTVLLMSTLRNVALGLSLIHI